MMHGQKNIQFCNLLAPCTILCLSLNSLSCFLSLPLYQHFILYNNLLTFLIYMILVQLLLFHMLFPHSYVATG